MPRLDRSVALLAVAAAVSAFIAYATSGTAGAVLLLLVSATLVGLARQAAGLARQLQQSQQVIGQLTATAPELSKASFDSAKVSERARLAAVATQAAASNVMAAHTSASAAADAVDATAQVARQTQAASQAYAELLRSVDGDLQSTTSSTQGVARRMSELSRAVQTIREAAVTIQQIAAQTRLLALNAAIEAARAGEAGRGFAVVAAEVRKLSDVSSEQGQAIGEHVSSILSLNAQAVIDAERTSTASSETAQKVQTLLSSVGETVSAVSVIAERLAAVSESAAVARHTTADVAQVAHRLAKDMQDLGELSGSAGEKVSHSIERLLSGMALQDVDCEHARFKALALKAARDAGQVLEQAIANGSLQAGPLFEPVYTPVPGTDPPKNTVGWDSYTDQNFPAIQEPLLEQGAAYAIVVNRDGYCPTHNHKFSQPLTGDKVRDLAGNRTKRIFTDKVGQSCAAHESVLVQTYLRDTGETMHDLSVPVHVQGRHWGAVRVGYLAGA